MTCAEFQAVVMDLGRRRLDDPGICEQASVHASRCGSCAEMLGDEEAVTIALRDLRVATSEEAPAWMERALWDALQRQRPPRMLRRRWTWPAAAAAASVTLAIAGLSWLGASDDPAPALPAAMHRETAPRTAASAPRGAAPEPHERAATVTAPSAPHTAAQTPAQTPAMRRRRGPKASSAVALRERSRETVTDFVWLPYGAPAAFETAQVVRVRLPRSVLPSIGLAMDGRDLGDRVHADLVVGEDGLARAIRLVQTKSTNAPFE